MDYFISILGVVFFIVYELGYSLGLDYDLFGNSCFCLGLVLVKICIMEVFIDFLLGLNFSNCS